MSGKKKLQLSAATQRRKMLCSSRRSNSIAMVVWGSGTIIIIFTCVAAQSAGGQVSRLVTVLGNENPGSANGNMSGI